MKKRVIKALAITIVVAGALVMSVGAGHAFVYRNSVYPGVHVESLDVGGRTQSAAAKMIGKAFSSPGKMSLTFRKKSWAIDLKDFGAKVQSKKTARDAFSVGRDQELIANLSARYEAWSTGKETRALWKLDKNLALAVLGETAKTIDQPEVNAKLLIDYKNVKIEPHQDGRRMLVKTTLTRLLAAFAKDRSRVRVAVKEWQPKKTTEAIKKQRIETMLAEFSTKLSPIKNNRRHNIELTMNKLDGLYVAPGSTFSFNNSVGRRTSQNGYRTAPVIVGGNLVPGIGGGICQVATTLYNAAMASGLPILERSLHSNYISSYPAGRDSTVVDGQIDLKFRNDTDGTLLIKTVILRDAVAFRVYGPKTGRVTTFSDPAVSSYTNFSTKTETDTTLPTGVTVRKQAGISGRTVRVIRKVRLKDKILIDELITSRYVPRQEILRVGPAPKPKPVAKPVDTTATPPSSDSTSSI